MGGFITEHTVNEAHYRNEATLNMNVITKRTEELWEQKEDGEIKRQYREKNGSQYMESVVAQRVDTIYIGRQENQKPRAIIGLDKDTGQWGFWRVDANGTKHLIAAF